MKLPAGDWPRDIAFSLSLANLCNARAWGFMYSPTNWYLNRDPPGWTVPASAATLVLALTVVFLLVLRMVRSARSPWLRTAGRIAFAGLLLLVLNAFRQHVESLQLCAIVGFLGRPLSVALGAGAVAGLAALAARTWSQLLRAAVTCVLVLTPFAFITLGRAAYMAVSLAKDARFHDRPAAGYLEPLPEVRVVVLLFDELDQRMTFEDRPGGLALPELDRLRQEGLFAANAYPANARTSHSMPSIISGVLLENQSTFAPNDLRLRLPNETQYRSWSELPNVFGRARELGVNSAMSGWYHPYCRVVGSLVGCSWFPSLPPPQDDFAAALRTQMVHLAFTVPFAVRAWYDFGLRPPEELPAEWHWKAYQGILTDTLRFSSDPRIGLVFSHFPIPHAPYVFSVAREAVDLSGAGGYAGNLALVDFTIRAVRRGLEATGLSKHTVLIVTSDHAKRAHGYRTGGLCIETPMPPRFNEPGKRVPFVVAFPGDPAGVVHELPFHNHVLADAVPAILARQIESPAQLAAWLDEQSRSTARRPS